MKTPFPKYDEALVARIEEDLDQVRRTEIAQEIDMVNFGPGGEPYEVYTLLQSRGSHAADVDRSITPRMMIQSISTLPTLRSQGVIYNDPCAACDNFAYSWKCADHPELSYDSEKHRWIKPDSRPSYIRVALNEIDQPWEGGTVGDPFVNDPIPDLAAHITSSDPLDTDGTILEQFRATLPDNHTPEQGFDVIRQYVAALNRIAGAQ